MSESQPRTFFFYLILTFITAACFWQVRNFDFINYDDNLYVTENSHVLSGLTIDNIGWAFTTGHTGYWHPITWISLMLDIQLFGPDAGRIHLINLAFHVVNTLLLFAFLKRVTGRQWASGFAAVLFAIHPMHVESVAWISERKDVLSTFFFLLTLIAYADYVKRKNLLSYILSLVLFGLGICAKPMLVSLPLILLLMDYWPLERLGFEPLKNSDNRNKRSAVRPRPVLSQLLIEKIPFVAISSAAGVITFVAQRGGGIAPDLAQLSLGSRIANCLLAYARYIGKMFWPTGLSVFYPFDINSFGFLQVLFCGLLILFITILIISFARKQKYLLTGWLWFIVTLLPVAGLMQSGSQAYADRYTYISYVGLFIMAAWGLQKAISVWPKTKYAIGSLALIIVIIFGTITSMQISYWKNSSTLFSHALEVNQNNFLAHYNLADDLLKSGQIGPALEHCKKALQIQPGYMDAAMLSGYIYARQGEPNQAAEYFSKAVSISPHFAQANYNLAMALQQAKRFDEAAGQYAKVIQLEPNMPAAMNNFAWLIATHPEIKNRDYNEAIRLASGACEFTRYQNPVMLGTLAASYAAAGKFTDAVGAVQRALSVADKKDKNLVGQLEYHLSLYQNSRPFIETRQN